MRAVIDAIVNAEDERLSGLPVRQGWLSPLARYAG
jgi:hypothetical protein